MAASSAQTPVQRRRRWPVVLLAILVGLAALYSGAWLWAAGWLEREAEAALRQARAEGADASCAELRARGYPFRMELACVNGEFTETRDQVAVSAASIRGGASIWSPFTLASDVVSPVTITAPGGVALKLDWRSLTSTVRLATPLPRSVGLRLSQGAASLAGAGGAAIGTLRSADIALDALGRDLAAKATLRGLAASPGLVAGRSFPEIDAALDLLIADAVLRASERNPSLRGLSGTLRQAVISSGESAALTLAGPFDIGDDGLLNAELMLTVRDPQAVAALLGGVLPEKRGEIAAAFAGLTLMGANAALPVRIEGGRAMLAFVPLGDIPAVK